MALLMFVQLLVADVVGIRAKHMPGSSVPADHDNLLFRATRVVANCNESIVIFALAMAYCLLSRASPDFTSYAAWGYVVSRLGYALCYYFDFRTPRSVVFGISLLMIAALLVIGLVTGNL